MVFRGRREERRQERETFGRGGSAVRYQMQGHPTDLGAGDLCIFWGGLPHRVVDTGEDTLFIAIHLPLIHFFRLRLASEIQQKLMRGATLVTAAPDREDDVAFRRWAAWMALMSMFPTGGPCCP